MQRDAINCYPDFQLTCGRYWKASKPNNELHGVTLVPPCTGLLSNRLQKLRRRLDCLQELAITMYFKFYRRRYFFSWYAQVGNDCQFREMGWRHGNP